MVFFELFANNPEIVRVPAGQPLFTAGEEGHSMFVLSTGHAEVIVNNRVVETLQLGNIVGEMGIVAPGRGDAAHGHAVEELVHAAPSFASGSTAVVAVRFGATKSPPVRVNTFDE